MVDFMGNHGFQCLACESPHIELDLASMQKHFASKHRVPNLLSSPATQVFLFMSGSFTSSLSCRRQLCRQRVFQAATLIPATRASPSTSASSVEERGCVRTS